MRFSWKHGPYSIFAGYSLCCSWYNYGAEGEKLVVECQSEIPEVMIMSLAWSVLCHQVAWMMS